MQTSCTVQQVRNNRVLVCYVIRVVPGVDADGVAAGGGGGGVAGVGAGALADGAGAVLVAAGTKSANAAMLSSLSQITIIGVPRGISVVPASTSSFATNPSSVESNDIVALSVSISPMASPAATSSLKFKYQIKNEKI